MCIIIAQKHAGYNMHYFQDSGSSGDKMTRKMIWILKKGKTKSKSDLAKYYRVLNIDFFFSFIFISWRLITLQYCSGFVIHWHESAMDLHVFPIPISPPASLPIPSPWVFPVHQPRALVSCIQSGLVVCFTLDSILVSMLFSQNIPPSLSPTESQSLFCTAFVYKKYLLYVPKCIFQVGFHFKLGGASGKEPICQCRRCKRCGFDPWVKKSHWRRVWQPTPVFLLENPMDIGDRWDTVHKITKSWTWLKQLRMHAHIFQMLIKHINKIILK